MTTAQDQQSRADYEDGKWYWVEREGWHGEPPTIAPACYKAECDAWYSYIFSGISTPYLKVLEPCELQAARALPAGMEPGAWRTRHRSEPGMIGHYPWTHTGRQPRQMVPPAYDIEPLYTAAQVQAMLAQGMEHACNLWVDPESLQYVVDSCDHPCAELIPAYIAAAPRPPAP